jgi:hypothetical protein
MLTNHKNRCIFRPEKLPFVIITVLLIQKDEKHQSNFPSLIECDHTVVVLC